MIKNSNKLDSKSRKSLVFTLFDGEYHESDNIKSDDYRFSFFRKNTFYIPAPEFELENRGDEYRGDREMNVSMMMEKVNGNRNSLVAEKEKVFRDSCRSVAPPVSRPSSRSKS